MSGRANDQNNNGVTAVDKTRRTAAWLADHVVWVFLFGALVLYLVTLDNGFQPEELRGGDLITHQYAQVEARPSNAPGYPLYTMGGWLWFRFMHLVAGMGGNGLPNPIPLLSSYSTLWALLALWFLYQILTKLMRRLAIHTQSAGQAASALPFGPPNSGWLLAGLLTSFYATTYFFWYYATTTEQYSSAVAQTLAIVYFYLQWQESLDRAREDAAIADPSAASGAPVRRMNRRTVWLLFLLALLCGLSLAHMLTVAFIVPPLLLVILWQAPWLLRKWRTVLGAIFFAALPLTSYLYIYWRGTVHPEWWGAGQWSSPQAWFWSFVSTAQGREELGWGFMPWCTPLANGFPALMMKELTWPVVLCGLIGFCLIGRRLGFLFWGTTLIYLAFCWAYRCGNWFQVILPLYPLLIIGLGLFLQRCFGFLAARFQRQKTDSPGAAANTPVATGSVRWLLLTKVGVNVILLIVIGLRVQTLWPVVDSRNRTDDRALDHAALLLARPLPVQQPLFASLDDTLALQYLIHVWGIQPALRTVSAPQAATVLNIGGTVYSTWEMAPTLRAELPDRMAVTQVAVDPNWIQFAYENNSFDELPLAAQPLVDYQALDKVLAPTIALHAYQMAQAPPSPLAAYHIPGTGATGIDVTLLWALQADRWPEDLAISVRLTTNGQIIEGAQIDRAQPALGLSAAVAGYMPDPYHFALADGAASTADGILLVLYRATDAGFDNVAVVPLTW